MENRRHNRNRHRNRNWNNEQKNNNNNSNNPVANVKKYHYTAYENPEVIEQREKAIKEIKERQIICPKCGEEITDIASAMSDKASGKPLHFECAMEDVSSGEKLGPNEKIAYIGQGRFAILYYENIRDQRHFQIKKIIEWEERDKTFEWRDELSGLYSKIE